MTPAHPMDVRPMPAQDNLRLVLDRPENLLTITAVLWTAEPVDPARLRNLVQERIVDRYPVFHRRAVPYGTVLRSAVWVDDRDFDLDRHLQMLPMPAPGAAGLLPEPLGPAHIADVVEDTATAMLHSAGSVVKILGWSNPDTAAAWGDPVALDLLAGIGHATGTTVNDVCLTLVAGAVARYLAERGQDGPVPDLAWMVPVNLEPLDSALPAELGNHFALVLAVLPHGVTGFRERLAEVHRRMVLIRDSWEARLVWISQVGIAMSPAPLATAASDLLAAKAVGVLTDVPGPRHPMALAGARVEGMVGWAPTSGRQAVSVCVFSYAGRVSVGFGTDRAVVPDPERLAAAFDTEVAEASQIMNTIMERTPS